VESRLETAKQMGVDATLVLTREDKDEEVVERLTALLGVRPDVVIDASGAPLAQAVTMMVLTHTQLLISQTCL
jgi:threonine dehydrogenase-like Zn-dependent dehydrogenase